MTCIYLYVRGKLRYRAGSCVKVTVSCENNAPCKLFKKYKHELCPPTSDCIYVFKSLQDLTTYVALTPNGDSNFCLKCVDVYFNKHENKTPLLFVLIFKNGDGSNGVTNRYYRMSCYDTDAKGCATKKIQELCQYNSEASILCALIQENDTLKEFLTYDIMQRPGNGDATTCKYNCGKIEVTNDTNGDEPKLTEGNGFNCYKHTPVNGANGGHQSKKACVVYRCQALLGSGQTELGEIQCKTYSCVKVYFGTKAKRPCTDKGAVPGVCACPLGTKGDTCTKGEGGSVCPPSATGAAGNTCPACPAAPGGATEWQDVPLMLELHKKPSNGGDSATNGPDYYVHRRKTNNGGTDDQYYWVKLEAPKGDNGPLKDVLQDIGLSQKPEEGNGTTLQSKLGEKPANGADGTTDSNGQTTYLTLLLRRIEFDLTDSVVILMDKRNGSSSSNGGYGDTEITQAIGTLQPKGQTGINPLKLNNGVTNGGQKNIGVSDAKNGLCKCLTDYKYRVVEHDFQKAVSKLTSGCWAGLRFLIPIGQNGGEGRNGNKYAQLKLYSTDTKAANLQYIYYTKNGDHNCAKAYVVFYKGTGESSSGGDQGDPRPLMLCYQKQVYRPKSKEDYDCQKWVKVTGLDSLKKCLCQNGQETINGANDKLLGALTKVVGFLNTVDLSKHPNGTSTSAGEACQTSTTASATTQCQPGSDATTSTTTCTYTVHQFQGKPIKVQVECCPVKANGSSCYKKLTHKPAGMNGSTVPNTGFRLGDVEYCPNGGTAGKRHGKIDYYGNGSNGSNGNISDKNKWAPLVKVHSYFYNDDTKYCDPLLVVLEFDVNGKCNGVAKGENENKEYYKLTSANVNSLAWAKDQTAKCLVDSENGKLASYLDQIRYCLKSVVRIHLECRTGQYPLMGREANGKGTGKFDKPINGQSSGNGTVQVEVCDCTCPSLKSSNYKCVKHNLTQALKGKQDKVAGLAFTLPCENGGAGQNVTCCIDAGNGVSTSGVANGFVEIPVCVAGQGEAKCAEGTKTGCQAEEGQSAAICTTVPPGSSICPAAPATTSLTCPPKPGTIPPILYNSCMGDVYVYFYACKNGGTESCGVSTDATGSDSCSPKNNGKNGDTVPLMLRYNSQFYRPCDRDNYFTKWECVSALCTVDKAADCGCAVSGAGDHGDSCEKLVTELDKVNEALNRIDLDRSSLANGLGSSNGKGYGLPETCDKTGGVRGCKLTSEVGNVRVCLTKQDPKGTDAKTAYERVIHRTKNGFRIGCITYCGHEIVACGITPKGQDAKNGGDCTPGSSVGAACSASSSTTSSDCTIKVANGSKTNGTNHTAHVSSCGWNTVVAYYSCSDKDKKLPQLIVILKTDNPVSNGEPVTVSGDKYGYYILAAQNGVNSGGSGYEYKWVEVNGKEKPETRVTLDDETDFKLLNAGVILLERRVYNCGSCSYGESEISAAIASAIKAKQELTSPGNNGQDINRLKGKTIEVKDETSGTGSSAGAGTCASSGDGTSTGVCCCKCLAGTGFKAMSHDITSLVELTEPFKDKLANVTLITGLKLLTPTRASCQYKQVTLNGSTAGGVRNGATDSSIKYHHPGKGDKICVYFYDRDPRPLLVCYNGWAYRANSKDDYDAQKWHKDTTAGECKCTDPQPEKCDQCPLLKALVAVSDFLNRVMIHIVPKPKYNCWFYYVHEFNGCVIRLKVTSKPASDSFCFNRYTHEHYGIGCGGEGFRLGNVHYKKECIKENGDGAKNGTADKCINSVIEKNGLSPAKPCETASHVVVFYYKHDSKHETPVLVAMCKNDNTSLTCNLYYVLKNRAGKIYEKRQTELNMNDEKKLGDALDAALFTSAKKLQIVLSQRPQPAKYSPVTEKQCTHEEAKKPLEDSVKHGNGNDAHEKVKYLVTCKYKVLEKMADDATKTAKIDPTRKSQDPVAFRASLMHHVLRETKYEGKLLNGQPETPPSSPPTETTITVTEVDCTEIHSIGGYRCFQHLLTQAKGIEQVGGLKLYLWADGQGTPSAQEITLCTGGTNGTTNGKNGGSTDLKPVQLSYTTCKGDLYVFFYGDDPRPMMLCYDGHAYRPTSLETYCRQWVRVNNGANGASKPVDCLCDTKQASGTRFNSAPLLAALYRVSVFMNPVKLCLTQQAIEAMKHKREGQSDQPSKPAKPLEFLYSIDKNPPQCIQVRIVPQDLNCYRCYTHKTAKEGFRLGEVTYAEAKDEGGAGASASVQPASCAAGTSGTPSTTCSAPGKPGTSGGSCSPSPSGTTSPTPYCFAYDYTKQLWSVSVYYYMYDSDHKWPLVVELWFKRYVLFAYISYLYPFESS